MTTPGVGPVVSADLYPRHRRSAGPIFRNSKAVGGGCFGLTPSKYQSGQINRTGAISKLCGDEMMRGDGSTKQPRSCWCVLAKWFLAQGLGDERSPGSAGMKGDRWRWRARLAVIMHRIWVDGTEFPLDQGKVAAA